MELGSGWVCSRCGCSNQGSCCARCGWEYRTGGGVVKCGGYSVGCGTSRTVQPCADTLQIRSGNGCGNARRARSSECSGTKADSARNDVELLCFCVETGSETSNAAPVCRERRTDEDCHGQARQSAREARCGEDCQQAENAAAYGRGCVQEQKADSRRRHDRAVGMVYAEEQELGRVYESPSALKAGTLFPELHKPLNGYCPDGERCALCGQAEAFALWELRLYLNTHPDDQEALCLFRRLCEEAGEPNYASSFLTGDCSDARWEWADDPWPWETCFNRCE